MITFTKWSQLPIIHFTSMSLSNNPFEFLKLNVNLIKFIYYFEYFDFFYYTAVPHMIK